MPFHLGKDTQSTRINARRGRKVARVERAQLSIWAKVNGQSLLAVGAEVQNPMQGTVGGGGDAEAHVAGVAGQDVAAVA